MRTLDCESVDSAYSSLESITGVPRTHIAALLRAFDVNEYCAREPAPLIAHDQAILRDFIDKFGCTLSVDACCWFHLTRVKRGETFAEGILPLNSAVKKIWEFLRELAADLVTDAEWKALRANRGGSHSAWLYNWKTENPKIDGGPFGALVRDEAFNPRYLSNHDYLAAPEIVEDICACFEEKHGKDLLARFKENTVPCIVKFQEVKMAERRELHFIECCVRAVLCYLHNAERGLPPHRNSSWSFDGEGVSVPNCDILRIEFLN